MNLQEIYALIDRFDGSSLTSLEVELGGARLKLSRGQGAELSPRAAAPALGTIEKKDDEAPKEEQGLMVSAPLVGVFYSAPSPGKKPFVTPGSPVKKGQTLCLVEAMKVMNEVPSPCDGVILKVLAQNEQLVEYGAPLFLIGEDANV